MYYQMALYVLSNDPVCIIKIKYLPGFHNLLNHFLKSYAISMVATRQRVISNNIPLLFKAYIIKQTAVPYSSKTKFGPYIHWYLVDILYCQLQQFEAKSQ